MRFFHGVGAYKKLQAPVLPPPPGPVAPAVPERRNDGWKKIGFPEGYPLVNSHITMEHYGKSPCLLGKSTNLSKWQFSIAMLNYRRSVPRYGWFWMDNTKIYIHVLVGGEWSMTLFFHILGIMNNHPKWLIFFQRGMYTTNQFKMDDLGVHRVVRKPPSFEGDGSWRLRGPQNFVDV